jgi:hypothetical protein
MRGHIVAENTAAPNLHHDENKQHPAAPVPSEEHALQRMIIGFTSAAGEYDFVRAAVLES